MVIASLGGTDAIHMVPQFFGHDNREVAPISYKKGPSLITTDNKYGFLDQRYHTQHLWRKYCLIPYGRKKQNVETA
jgi:hypothetical protein